MQLISHGCKTKDLGHELDSMAVYQPSDTQAITVACDECNDTQRVSTCGLSDVCRWRSRNQRRRIWPHLFPHYESDAQNFTSRSNKRQL